MVYDFPYLFLFNLNLYYYETFQRIPMLYYNRNENTWQYS